MEEKAELVMICGTFKSELVDGKRWLFEYWGACDWKQKWTGDGRFYTRFHWTAAVDCAPSYKELVFEVRNLHDQVQADTTSNMAPIAYRYRFAPAAVVKANRSWDASTTPTLGQRPVLFHSENFELWKSLQSIFLEIWCWTDYFWNYRRRSLTQFQ